MQIYTGVVLDTYMGTHINLSKLGGHCEWDTIVKDNFKPKTHIPQTLSANKTSKILSDIKCQHNTT